MDTFYEKMRMTQGLWSGGREKVVETDHHTRDDDVDCRK